MRIVIYSRTFLLLIALTAGTTRAFAFEPNAYHLTVSDSDQIRLQVFLNGQLVYPSQEGRPTVDGLAVGKWLREGENTLEARFVVDGKINPLNTTKAFSVSLTQADGTAMPPVVANLNASGEYLNLIRGQEEPLSLTVNLPEVKDDHFRLKPEDKEAIAQLVGELRDALDREQTREVLRLAEPYLRSEAERTGFPLDWVTDRFQAGLEKSFREPTWSITGMTPSEKMTWEARENLVDPRPTAPNSVMVRGEQNGRLITGESLHPDDTSVPRCCVCMIEFRHNPEIDWYISQVQWCGMDLPERYGDM